MRKYVMLYGDASGIVEELSDQQAGRLLKAVLVYARTGEIVSLPGSERLVYKMLIAQFERDREAVGWLGRSRKTETGHLDSKTGFAGLTRKGLMLLTVLMAALLDRALGGESAMFRGLMIWFYIANEGLSILKNLTLAGVPFPARVREALEQLRDKNDRGDTPL